MNAKCGEPRRARAATGEIQRAAGNEWSGSTSKGERASDATEATHVSLYDGTVEGLDFPDLSARSAQFHPEAGPGPHDAWPLLDEWVAEVAYAQAA